MKKILDQICHDLPCAIGRAGHGQGCYCLLKEILEIDAKYNDRLLAQMDCLSRFKYDEGQRLGKDPTWKGALAAWIEQGYAKRFGDLFNPETPLPELYRLITSVPPIAPEPAGSVTPAPAP